MSPSPADRSQRIDAVFDALLDLPPDEQLPYLDRAAGDDPTLHDEVLRLLQAHRRSEGFLDTPAPRVARELLEQPDLVGTGGNPDRVGPWRIVRLIGEGGMRPSPKSTVTDLPSAPADAFQGQHRLEAQR